jgi:hypothetical protein
VAPFTTKRNRRAPVEQVGRATSAAAEAFFALDAADAAIARWRAEVSDGE